MKPGIYHVTFSSPTSHISGEGLAVITDGAINGGDQGYLYTGKFTAADSVLSSKLTVKQWRANFSGVFGNLSGFDLDLKGRVSDDWKTFSMRGNMTGNPQAAIVIDGRRIADAA